MEGRGSSAIGTMHVTVHAVELDSHMMGEAFCVVRPLRPSQSPWHHSWAPQPVPTKCNRPTIAAHRTHRADSLR